MRAWLLVGLALVAAAGSAIAAWAVLAAPAGGGALGAGLARHLLVPADVRGERAVEAEFARAPRSGPPGFVLRRRAQIEGSLSGIANGKARPALRSRAATLLALLQLADAQSDPGGASRYATAARDALQSAVRLDPRNGAAAYDLELLFTSKARRGGRATQGQGPPQASGGAGAKAAGSGY